MLKIIGRENFLNEIAVGPGLTLPPQSSSSLRPSSKIKPDSDAQRIIPLLVSRYAVRLLRASSLGEADSNEVLDRILRDDSDKSNPMSIAYLSNLELNALARVAAKTMRWSVANKGHESHGDIADQLERASARVFDAAKKAQEHSVNRPQGESDFS
jgi:hypothetical protein